MDDMTKLELISRFGMSAEIISKWYEHGGPDRAEPVKVKKNQIRIAKPIAPPAEESWEDSDKYCFTPKQMSDFLEANEGEDIDVILNSGGGSVYGGVEICSLLNGHAGNTRALIVGIAASAAAEIALACQEIEMAPGSICMMHAASSISWGTAAHMRKVADMLDRLSKSSRPYYEKRLSKELIDDIMKGEEDFWFNAEEALDIGFCDKVTEIKDAGGEKPAANEEDKDDGDQEIKAACMSLEINRLAFANLAGRN